MKLTKDAIDAFGEYSTKVTDQYASWVPANELETKLKWVANTIKAYNIPGTTTKRQTFFIALGGFDMHSELTDSQYGLLSVIDTALSNFWTKVDADMKSKVTLFTGSDFGRTLNSNGNGSDHGWAGNHIVLGGGVKGGTIYGYNNFKEGPTTTDYGAYPDFTRINSGITNTTINVGRGRLIAGTSVEEYLYPILKWYGLSNHDLFSGSSSVFPTYGSSARFNTGAGDPRVVLPMYV
jgi:hypothetical protein